MIHLSPFNGLLGFATLHPVLTLGPVLIAVLAAAIAGRRRSVTHFLRRRP